MASVFGSVIFSEKSFFEGVQNYSTYANKKNWIQPISTETKRVMMQSYNRSLTLNKNAVKAYFAAQKSFDFFQAASDSNSNGDSNNN